MRSVEMAWQIHHRELEQVCWEAHLPGVWPSKLLARTIIGSWMMKLVFYFAWEKALEEHARSTAK